VSVIAVTMTDAPGMHSIETLLSNSGWVRALAFHLCGDRATADDIVQETWLRALERPPGEPERERSWLRRVVTNLSISRHRSEADRARRERTVARSEAAPDDVLERIEASRRLIEHVLALDEPYRSTILNRYFDGRSAEQIASAAGVSASTIRTRLERGLALLHARLERDREHEWLGAVLPLLARGGDIAAAHVVPSAAAVLGGLVAMNGAKIAIAVVLLVFGAWIVWRSASRSNADASLARSSAVGASSAVESGSDANAALQQSGDASSTNRGVKRTVSAPAHMLTFAGTVLDTTENETVPAAGAHVQYWQGFGGEMSEPIVADAHGRFRVQLADPVKRPLDFHFTCDGTDLLRDDLVEVWLKDDSSGKLDIVLRRYPKGDLVGTTVDPSDAPLGNVKLTLHTADETRVVVSDSTGRFQLSHAPWVNQVEADRDGFMLVATTQPESIPSGGWKQMKIILASVGRLKVIVADADGRPSADMRVVARVSPVERLGWHPLASPYASQLSLTATTDAEGVARFNRLCAGERHALALDEHTSLSSTNVLMSERVIEGRLVLDGTTKGSPIVVRAGDELTVRATLPPRVRLSGRILDEAGAPVAKGSVGLVSIDALELDDMLRATTHADSNGEFLMRVWPGRSGRRVMLEASHNEPFIYLQGPKGGFARADVDLDAVPPEIKLVLREGMSISGRLIDGEGRPVRGRIEHYVPGEGPETPRDSGWFFGEKDGTFEVKGLTPGLYDLRAVPLARLAATWVRSVPAGTRGLEIRCATERAARVTIEAALREGEPGDLVSCEASLLPRVDVSGVPRLESDASYSEPTGWPVSALGTWTGGIGDWEARGLFSCSLSLLKQNPTTLFVDEGLHWFGVQARDKQGNHYFPIGTGLVRVEPGEYRLRFELTAAVPIEGRVHAGDVLGLAVGIAHGSLGLLELDVGTRRLERFRELGADGWFSFAQVPIGEHELWIGTSAELDAAKPSVRQPLTVGREKAPPLDVVVSR
jgi:RNA polymerase sigma-70 factor (ECF subfamily)